MGVESKILFLEIHSSTNLLIASLVQPELGKTAGSYPGITFFFFLCFILQQKYNFTEWNSSILVFRNLMFQSTNKTQNWKFYWIVITNTEHINIMQPFFISDLHSTITNKIIQIYQ